MYSDALEKRITGIEARLSKLEDALLRGGPQTTAGDLEAKLIEEASKINIQEMILISLRIKDKQTREQIKQSLQEWGKVSSLLSLMPPFLTMFFFKSLPLKLPPSNQFP